MRVTPINLTPSRPLTPADAVAAIIYTIEGDYLLQHRDDIGTIFYPDHWGCFGGAIDDGESAMDALQRELQEELALAPADYEASVFSHFKFDVKPVGIAAINRTYYQLRIPSEILPHLRLGEGREMRLLSGEAALQTLRLVPYDGFALWLHVYRGMLVGPA